MRFFGSFLVNIRVQERAMTFGESHKRGFKRGKIPLCERLFFLERSGNKKIV